MAKDKSNSTVNEEAIIKLNFLTLLGRSKAITKIERTKTTESIISIAVIGCNIIPPMVRSINFQYNTLL